MSPPPDPQSKGEASIWIRAEGKANKKNVVETGSRILKL